MKRISLRLLTLCAAAMLLAGCADQQHSETALEAARVSFYKAREAPDVLRNSPRDVIRAGESLARADRYAGYWGSSEDVIHYAYLSQRYSDIASEGSQLLLNQERIAKLEGERQRLQQALRDAKLLSVQQQGQAQEEQMVSLTRNQGERGLVMTLGDVRSEEHT